MFQNISFLLGIKPWSIDCNAEALDHTPVKVLFAHFCENDLFALLRYRHNTGIIGLIFSARECFLRSWVNNLMVFKNSSLGLEKVVLSEKICGLGLVTLRSCYITGCR